MRPFLLERGDTSLTLAQFYYGTNADIGDKEYEDGSFYVATDDPQLYLDLENSRMILSGGVVLDNELSDTSIHPVENRVIKTALDGKANTAHTHEDSELISISASKITGVIDASHLPSYVDDVVEYDTLTDFPTTGETGKIYVTKNTNLTYRWTGSDYVEISQSLALGETSATAYRGDRGKVAYDHATAKGAAYTSGLYKVTTNAEGHVTNATAVVKKDITDLGIPAQDTTYTFTNGLSNSSGTVSNSGVRSIATGNANGTISVNTNGTAADVSVKGLGSNAFTSTAYLPLTGGTLTGRLTGNGKLSLPTTGSSWISGKTTSAASIEITTQQTASNYHPILAVKTASGNVFNIGGINDTVGFYDYLSARTANGTDHSFTFNTATGDVVGTNNLTMGGYVTVGSHCSLRYQNEALNFIFV